MKIGQVVRQYGLTAHSIYFYINSGLLVPPRRNNQYVFDQRTLEDLDIILNLKDMDFPLKTIHRVLSLRRISNFCSMEDRAELKNIYLEQNRVLRDQEERLRQSRQKLSAAMDQCDITTHPQSKTGVPLSMLSLLRCPDCGAELMLSDVNMNSKYIFHGRLTCTCGYCASIRDGIIETGHINTSSFDKPDVTRELYRDLPSETLSLFEQSYRWLEDRITGKAHSGKVWLEGHVNAWFFFHNHLNLLHDNDQLIVVDKFPETLQAYKKIIEWAGAPCDILYIADCSSQLPLKKSSVDYSMDFFASNEYNFYHDGLYLDQLLPYLRDTAEAFGVYFFFENGERSMQTLMRDYPESSPDNFNLRWFNQALGQNFCLTQSEDCGSAISSGDNLGLGFHVSGEVLHLWSYHARVRRQSPPAT